MSGTAVATAVPATLGRRAFAYFIDSVMFWIVSLFVVAFLSALAKGSAKTDLYTGALLSAAVGFAYFFFSWTTYGTSPGQRMLGLRTVTYGNGTLLTPRNAATRWAFLYGASTFLVPLLSLVSPASTPFANAGSLVYFLVLYSQASRDRERRALHDRQSNSIVVGAGSPGGHAFATAVPATDGEPRPGSSEIAAPSGPGRPRPRTAPTVDPLWAGAVVLLIGAILLLQRLITALPAAR